MVENEINKLQRKQTFEDAENCSIFLWGARQTGKSTLLKTVFPDVLYIDLLMTTELNRYLLHPEFLRETLLAHPEIKTVIIDEIPLLPALLNEVHWLIENAGVRFIMSGSSPRKILHSGVNLLGGRALRYELYPLVSAEIPNFDLLRALNNGLLPKHYNAANAKRMLASYIGSYLRDEIIAEARIRDVPAFTRFLEIAAITSGEMVNFSNIASDTGVAVSTVKSYFQILEDTLLGRFLPSYQKKPKRRVITAPKFYLFDVGIVNSLLNRGKIEFGTELFGKAFEHFIYQEIYAHSRYSGLEYVVSYWRTASQFEVDFILGENEVAVEVKSTDMVNSRHLKGLRAFAQEYECKKLIVVSNEPMPRLTENSILILPWREFLRRLWSGEII